MYLVFLIVCLAMVLLTLENLIVSGFYAKSHRLLPLVMGLLALYDFYLIVEKLTGESKSFDILKLLLLVQLLDVILYYIIDFTRIKLNIFINIIIISLLILVDIVIFKEVENPGLYRTHVLSFVVISVIGIMLLIIKKHQRRI